MGKKKSAAKGEATAHPDRTGASTRPPKACLMEGGQLTSPFKQCLVEIFSRFDSDGDHMLSEEELQVSEMKSMFEWLDGASGGGLSLRGFVEMYKRQTEVSLEESWSDLTKLGYDESLKLRTKGESREEWSNEVSERLRDFSKLSEEFMSFPASSQQMTAAKCETVRRTSTALGLECQMLQLPDGSEELCVFRPPETTGRASSPSSPSDNPSSPKKSPSSSPVFSALELDCSSCQELQETFTEFIPDGWTIYAHHMTICLGSLADARSNGNKLSEDLQALIRQLKPKDRRSVKVVSIGRTKGVVAVGVIGCPSVNQVPHITLACAKGHKPVESNSITKWQRLEVFHSLSGVVREFEQKDASAGLTAATREAHERLIMRLKELEAEVLAARAIHFSQLQDADERTLQRAIQEREQELASLKLDDDDGWKEAKSVKTKVKGKMSLFELCSDGNGVVNFGEFASWAGPRLGLELGVAKMLGKSASLMMASSPCSVIGCPCEAYGGKDEDDHGKKCKECKHKRGLHVAKATTGEVPFPPYWSHHDGDFNELISLPGKTAVEEFQKLLDKTYRKAYTKDRAKHNPTNPKVPQGFEVLAVKRNENKNTWQEYAFRRGDIMSRPDRPEIFADVKTSLAMDEIGGDKANRLLSDCILDELDERNERIEDPARCCTALFCQGMHISLTPC
ncbi:Uncharacterized protein SCF082_LOCUS49148 [Durusdinium trenchii]|uniref:EF-hand domain-containing protein n=1 Tax=Durusdinium trenchii TaxID=1381693 RepID=A0ABP0RYC4_9DINO